MVGEKHSNDVDTLEIKSILSRRVQSRLTGETLGLQAWYHPRSHRIPRVVGEPWDVAHLHNLHGYYFDLAVVPKLAAAAPTILTLHDMWLLTGHCAYSLGCERWRVGCGECPDLSIYPSVRFDLTRFNHSRKRRLIPDSAVAVSGPSSWIIDMVAESYLAALPRRFIPNPVDTEVFQPGDQRRAREELRLPLDRPLVLFPVRLSIPGSQFKDQEMFLEALPLLRDIGAIGIALGDVEAARRAGVAGDIRIFPATLDEARMALLYQAADVVVHPSRAETVGLAILEAMACSRPVVATRVGGIPEIVDEGNTGYLVESGDVAGLAASSRALLRSAALRDAFGAAARAAAVARFSLEGVVTQWLDWYEELCIARTGHVGTLPEEPL